MHTLLQAVLKHIQVTANNVNDMTLTLTMTSKALCCKRNQGHHSFIVLPEKQSGT